MAMPPLTIRKPETLEARLGAIETAAVEAAVNQAEKTVSTYRINGKVVEFTVTPSIQPGRNYTLFYVDGKRQARHRLSEILLGN